DYCRLMSTPSLLESFQALYGDSQLAVRCFFAPGRVNLIGDHIDYLGGLVLPCAIRYGTTLLARANNSDTIRLASLDIAGTTDISLHERLSKTGDSWFNYPMGVIDQWQRENKPVTGLDILYSGNLPPASGLSSSAALEVVTAFTLHCMGGVAAADVAAAGAAAAGATPPDLPALALLCQRAENQFVGVQCGIMDQYSSACGREQHAMMLNCQTLDCEHIPVQLGEYELVLINSNQARGLSDSKYNERVDETSTALTQLQTRLPIGQLTELTPEALDSNADLLAQHPVLLKRVRHVAGEQARVQQAAVALTAGDITRFGELMYASHDSLDQNYEVSSDPLNCLVDNTRSNPAVLGARLTGAGFGGCTVNIVHSSHVDEFCHTMATDYRSATGLDATFLRTTACDGVRELP
nr:galactokinase [Gammaproteobacteria bacterium]